MQDSTEKGMTAQTCQHHGDREVTGAARKDFLKRPEPVFARLKNGWAGSLFRLDKHQGKEPEGRRAMPFPELAGYAVAFHQQIHTGIPVHGQRGSPCIQSVVGVSRCPWLCQARPGWIHVSSERFG